MLSLFFLITNGTGQPFTLSCLFCLCVVVVLLFSLFFLRHSDGSLHCVLVLCQFNFCSPRSMKMDDVTALIK